MDQSPDTRIQKSPGVCGGKPCIAGTRIRVWDVEDWMRSEGGSVGDFLDAFPGVLAEDVQAALEYCSSHRAEVERYRIEEEKVAETYRASTSSIPPALIADGRD
ncbi:MAG: DUF433 domain-containing protein [Candidatus Omnitrophica bacterium]|nr:DUF433 domain-containing protein [Candidatus Omnitrophota bacterium]